MYSSSKLFVGCLPFSKTEADVSSLFSAFGELAEVALLRNGDGSSKGAGFVTFANAQCALNATRQLQGYVFEGSTRGINVNPAGPGGPSAGMGGGGGGGVKKGGGGGMGSPKGKGKGKSQQPSFQKGSQLSSQKDVPGAKVFVGKLPFSRSENDLMQLFSSCGPVLEVALLKNKATGEKKGGAFVKFSTPQHAAAAVTALNGFTFHGSTRPISVEIAQGTNITNLGTVAGGDGKRSMPAGFAGPGCKLFVGQLPFSKSELSIKEAFQTFGTVLEVMLHRDASGQKTGGAFVSFTDPDSASAALELDGYIFPASTRPITVSLATKRQRTQ